MSLTVEQHAARARGLGGSDCAVALGLSKRKTALQLYLEKRGEVPAAYAENDDMWWGRMLEPIVRQKYAEVTGRVVRMPEGTLVSPEYDFMVAHIDGVTDDGRGYEGKTAFHSLGWGDEGTDQVPEEYALQVHHYEIVTSLEVFDVACLIGRKFKLYEVQADKELHEMIIEGERDFMRRVREGDPPPLDYQHATALDVIKKMYPGTNGASVTATKDAIEWRCEMEMAAAVAKEAEDKAKALKARLLESMGEAALLTFPDGRALRRQKTKRAGYVVDSTEYIDSRLVKIPKEVRA